MAIAQPVVQVIKRSDNRSAVDCAAYRAGVTLKDERLGKHFNHSSKDDVTHSEILAPENCATWVFDREKLWNRAEAKERQWNGQPAREVLLTLPRELSNDERIALVRDFALKHFVSKGMVADINHHNPKSSDDGVNYHAHIMLTMRHLDGDDFAKTKERQWNRDFVDGGENIDPEKGAFFNKKKTDSRGWIGIHKNGMMSFRQHWEDAVNTALEESGSAERVDLRSYKAQGIDRIPQPKLGIHRYGRTNKAPSVLASHDTIRQENKRRHYRAAKSASRQRSQATTIADNFAVDYDLKKGFYADHSAEVWRDWQASSEPFDRSQGYEQEAGH